MRQIVVQINRVPPVFGPLPRKYFAVSSVEHAYTPLGSACAWTEAAAAPSDLPCHRRERR
jgi:hypothetical protein